MTCFVCGRAVNGDGKTVVSYTGDVVGGLDGPRGTRRTSWRNPSRPVRTEKIRHFWDCAAEYEAAQKLICSIALQRDLLADPDMADYVEKIRVKLDIMLSLADALEIQVS